MSEHADQSSRSTCPLGSDRSGGLGVGTGACWTVIATEAALCSAICCSRYFYLGAQGLAGWLLEPHPVAQICPPEHGDRYCCSVRRHGGGATRLTGGARNRARPSLSHWYLASSSSVWNSRLEGEAVPASAHRAMLALFRDHRPRSCALAGRDRIFALPVLGLRSAISSAAAHALVVTASALYWYFVTVVWLAIFVTFYISPYLDW